MSYQLLYLDYIDLATGKTLVVTPGSSYTVAVANGRIAGMASMPNDGRWLSAGGSIIPHASEPEPVESIFPQNTTWLGVSRELTEPPAEPAVTEEPESGTAGEGEEA